MIDTRALGTPPHVGSLTLEAMRAMVTRFYWIRACEHCLSRATYPATDGTLRCSGCERAVILGSQEDGPPA